MFYSCGGANPLSASKDGSSVVSGNSIITLTGSADNLLSIRVVSDDGYIEGTVLGTKYLVFDDFTSDFIATVTDSDVISFSGDTVMNCIGSYEVSTIEVDLTGRTEVEAFASSGFTFNSDD